MAVSPNYCKVFCAGLMVFGDKDVVILKTIIPLSLDEFDHMIASARRKARQAGLKKTDIDARYRMSAEKNK